MSEELKMQLARQIWTVMSEHEDRCDLEVEDVWPEHMLWAVTEIAMKELASLRSELEAARGKVEAPPRVGTYTGADIFESFKKGYELGLKQIPSSANP